MLEQFFCTSLQVAHIFPSIPGKVGAAGAAAVVRLVLRFRPTACDWAAMLGLLLQLTHSLAELHSQFLKR
jgi:hypothetical protein